MNYIDEHDINYSRYGFESLALAHPEIDIKGLWHCDSKYYVLIEKDGILTEDDLKEFEKIQEEHRIIGSPKLLLTQTLPNNAIKSQEEKTTKLLFLLAHHTQILS